MYQSIDADAPSIVLPELRLRDVLPNALGVNSAKYVRYDLRNTLLNSTGPFEFVIENFRNFIKLDKTFICFTFKVVKENGNVIPVMATADTHNEKFAPINNIAQSLFKSITVSLNDTLIYQSECNHAIKCYWDSTFGHDKDYKEHVLGMQ